MRRADDDVTERIAHALTPWEWSGRWLAVGIAALAIVGALIVVQRALLADSVVGWVITGIHAAVVLTVVPALSIRAVRRWRAVKVVQAPTGVPE